TQITEGVAAGQTTTTVYGDNEDDTVAVINGRTTAVTATIAVGGFPLAVAADPKTNTAYVTNNDGTVSVINGRTNTVTATIPVGLSPDAVAADPKAKAVYVANAGSGTVSVLAACPK